MTATTELYLQLQRTYREAAEADAAAVERRARAELQRLGRDPASIPRSAVTAFVKNARNIRQTHISTPELRVLCSRTGRRHALKHPVTGCRPPAECVHTWRSISYPPGLS